MGLRVVAFIATKGHISKLYLILKIAAQAWSAQSSSGSRYFICATVCHAEPAFSKEGSDAPCYKAVLGRDVF